MKQTMAVFRREVTARRDLLLLAVAVVLIVVMMPLVPGTEEYSPSAVRSLASQVLALLLGCGVAIGLGLSVFGSDLSAGRLGFFFARPLSARAIWAGRILAVLAIVFACESVVILPALVAERAHLFDINLKGWLAVSCAFIFLPMLLLLLSHALGVMNRARTAWLVLDLVGLLTAVVGSWLLIRPLYILGAVRAVFVVSALLAIAVIVALSVAGWVGLAVGRTDPRRTHGAMSLVLWTLVSAAVVALAIYSGWLRDFGPSEMDEVAVFSLSPDGGWVEVWGGAPSRLDVRRRILISTQDDRHTVLPVSWTVYSMELVYSADSRTAIALDSVSASKGYCALWRVDLTENTPTLTETHLVVPQRTMPALSPDGSRVALLEDGTLAVYDLASEELVTAIRLPTPFQKATVLFFEHDRLRLIARRGGDDASMTLIAEVDLVKNEVEETGRIESADNRRWIAIDSNAERMIFSAHADRSSVTRRSLRDARDGALIREFDDGGLPRFLADGRLVSLVDGPSGKARLVVESFDGTIMLEHSLGHADWESLGGEALPGRVVVGRLENLEERFEGRRYDLVDVDSGEIHPIAPGLRNAHPGFQRVWGGGGMVLWYIDSPESNRVFTDRSGAIVRWDPETGELVHIVGGAD